VKSEVKDRTTLLSGERVLLSKFMRTEQDVEGLIAELKKEIETKTNGKAPAFKVLMAKASYCQLVASWSPWNDDVAGRCQPDN